MSASGSVYNSSQTGGMKAQLTQTKPQNSLFSPCVGGVQAPPLETVLVVVIVIPSSYQNDLSPSIIKDLYTYIVFEVKFDLTHQNMTHDVNI